MKQKRSYAEGANIKRGDAPSEVPIGTPNPAAVAYEEPTKPAPSPAQDAPVAEPQLPWSNGRWAVTEHGMESVTTAGDRPSVVDYVIEAPRLLKLQPGSAGISMWAAQLAAKSWVDDVEPLMEALGNALSVHHPGQQVVDLAASAEVARRIWARSRRRG